MPPYIQTSQPWTVILDAAGNLAAVIVYEPPSRPPPSALFGEVASVPPTLWRVSGMKWSH